MAQQLINTGTAVNSGTGDTLRTAGIKINANLQNCIISHLMYCLQQQHQY